MFDRRRPALRSAVLNRSAAGLSAGVLLEVVACSIGLVGLIQGAGWWFALIGVAVLLLAIPAALRAVGVPPWLAAVLDAVVFVLVVQGVFAPDSAFGGIVPTRASIGELVTLFERGEAAVQNQHVPAEALAELIFFVVLFGGALTIVLDVLASVLRVPAVTALVMGGVLVVPAVLQPTGIGLIALGAGAAAWFVLLRLDGRLRLGAAGGGGVALTVGASVTLLSLVIAATAPGFIEQGRSQTEGPVSIGDGVNPLIDLGADLRRPTAVDVLRYTTTDTTPPYLQLTTLDSIHGTDWSHTPGPVSQLRGGSELAHVPGLDPSLGISAKPVTATIDVQDLRSDWLPVPYPATRVAGSPLAHTYQEDDLTVFAPGGRLAGEHYTTTSLDLEPTAAQLAARGPSQASDLTAVQRDLALPRKVPEIITKTAGQIAAGANGTSEYDLAVAIQGYFQDSLNGFTYSTDSPDTVDGASLDVIAKFLEVRQGYCVHFASAMAVIARVLGIPSRIAIGYLPGSAVSQTGRKITFQVNSSDLHAWPQLYFPGVGWLDFEPTVSRGTAPAYTVASTSDEPVSAPEQSAAASSAPLQLPSATALPTEQAAAASNEVAARNGVPLELGILIALAVLASPWAARALRRRGRLTRLREEGAGPELAWQEIRDTARDLGFAVSATETPRAFAARLRAAWHPDAAHQRDLDEILALVERSEFGPPRPWERYFELADRTVAVTAAMRASRHWTTRLVALIAPRSLVMALGERAEPGPGRATYDGRL